MLPSFPAVIPSVRRQSSFINPIVALALLAIAFTPLMPAPDVSAQESEFDESLQRINTYRSWLGIPPLERHSALDAAAQSHADYYHINGASTGGVGLHNQNPDLPGFTGATMSDRASAFGYSGSINENIGLSGSMIYTVNWSIATINHRLTLIDPRYQHIGLGAVNEGNTRIEVIKLGTPSWSSTFDPEWTAWPPDGTSGIGPQYLGSAPYPFTNIQYPVGYPVTLKYFGPGSVEFHSVELRANGASVPIHYGVGNGWLTRNTMMILAVDPLPLDTLFEVHIQGTANGQPVTHQWSFRTRASSSELPANDRAGFTIELPEGVSGLDPAMQETWSAADLPVLLDNSNRTWLWGPDTFAVRPEAYRESPDRQRAVAYFDKTRMEINDPNGDRGSQWFVTNGLLVRDMIRGEVQIGDHEYEWNGQAVIQLAGDDLEANPEAPTYSSLYPHSAANGDLRAPDRTGERVSMQLHANGTLSELESIPAEIALAHYDHETGFNIADVFWNWITNDTHYEWLYAIGHPIADPYWIRTRVDGEEQWVLVQAFQRRLLTYTPSNPPGWQLEMGNVGRHYYEWRYGELP
jgi:uncharacterized protein YkwD